MSNWDQSQFRGVVAREGPVIAPDSQCGIVLLYHGTDVEAALAAERQFADAVASASGCAGVAVAHLSGGADGIVAVVRDLATRGARRAVVVPMFLAPGLHAHRDIPLLVEECRARLAPFEVAVTALIGASPKMIDAVLALFDR